MEFRLLGPLELHTTDAGVGDLGTPKQRCVLSALLVRPGTPVPVEVLIDRVWGEAPPDNARQSLYSYIARLRRALPRTGDGADVRLLRRRGGYEMTARPESVDLVSGCTICCAGTRRTAPWPKSRRTNATSRYGAWWTGIWSR
ncbi:MAG: AfsR/SARP family transcriptional regulator [Micromonosporaceae bacterium]